VGLETERGAERMNIGGKTIGLGHPVYVIAEGGINHNGSLEIAKQLIDAAAAAGADAVKFQKRAPRLSTPTKEWNVLKQGTPWGDLSYIEYREHVEFGSGEHMELKRYTESLGLDYLLSVWDLPSLGLAISMDLPAIKIPSAMLTNTAIIETSARVAAVTTILSTGMSTMNQIEEAVKQWQQAALGKRDRLALLHCTSSYPCKPEELNLLMIPTLSKRFDIPIGYSNHSPGIVASVSAVTLGAKIVEAHITLDRTMYGTDQAASIEPEGFKRLVHYIRTTETSLGDGQKVVFDSELPNIRKLRGEYGN
jgi:N-acetylneuraminate synthase